MKFRACERFRQWPDSYERLPLTLKDLLLAYEALRGAEDFWAAKDARTKAPAPKVEVPPTPKGRK